MILSLRVCFQGWGLGKEGFGEWGHWGGMKPQLASQPARTKAPPH